MSSSEKKTQSEQKGNDLAKQIKKAVKGLVYSGESDAPVELFAGGAADAVTQENLLGQIGKAVDLPITEINFDNFFAPLTTLQDWYGDEEKAIAARYAALQELLKNNLKDLKVFKIGSTELDIYAVGLDAENKLTGIKTQTVET